MKYHRTVLAVVGISLLTGLGFAYGSVKNTTQQVRDGNEALVNFTDADLSNKGSIQKITALKATIKRLSAKLAFLEASQKPNPEKRAVIVALKARIESLQDRLERLHASPPTNQDRREDILRLKARIAKLRLALWNLRHDKEQLSREDRSLRGSDSDPFQRDGDERIQHLKHQGFQDNPHREAIREIEQGSHQRIASLYSPAHKSGFHARMHRHTR